MQQTIHLYPIDIQLKTQWNRSELEFIGSRTEKYNFDNEVRIIVHLEPYWIGAIARKLWQMINFYKKYVSQEEDVLKGERD